MKIKVGDSSYEVEVLLRERERVEFVVEGESYTVAFEQVVPRQDLGGAKKNAPVEPSIHSKKASKEGIVELCAPIPGVITELLFEEGNLVTSGDIVLKLEAMKMENHIIAPTSGVIVQVVVQVGEQVSDKQLLVCIASDNEVYPPAK